MSEIMEAISIFFFIQSHHVWHCNRNLLTLKCVRANAGISKNVFVQNSKDEFNVIVISVIIIIIVCIFFAKLVIYFPIFGVIVVVGVFVVCVCARCVL